MLPAVQATAVLRRVSRVEGGVDREAGRLARLDVQIRASRRAAAAATATALATQCVLLALKVSEDVPVELDRDFYPMIVIDLATVDRELVMVAFVPIAHDLVLAAGLDEFILVDGVIRVASAHVRVPRARQILLARLFASILARLFASIRTRITIADEVVQGAALATPKGVELTVWLELEVCFNLARVAVRSTVRAPAPPAVPDSGVAGCSVDRRKSRGVNRS